MNSLLDKLGLYDLLSYIIPGFLGILSLEVILIDLFHLTIPFSFDESFINSVILIILSYFIGINPPIWCQTASSLLCPKQQNPGSITVPGFFLVRLVGFEPTAFRVGVEHSIP